MKIIKSLWLEFIFFLFILISVVVGFQNLWKDAEFFAYNNPNMLSTGMTGISEKSLEDYIGRIASIKNCTAIFTVKDIPGPYLSQEVIDQFRQLGFEQTGLLMGNGYRSFIGIYSNGNVVCQHIGGDEQIQFGDEVNGLYIVAKSGTWGHGNTGTIYINDVSYSVNSRGINIVVVDNKNNLIIDSICFDTYKEDIPSYRLKDGKIVLVSERTKKNADKENEAK